MTKPLEDMTEGELSDVMIRCARAIEACLPPGSGPRGKSMFVLVVFDDPKVAQYISSCARDSMIEAMRETADRLESREDVTR
jgi:hypothetical protein